MIDEQRIRLNSLSAWILASRPKTLIGAIVPVILGLALVVGNADRSINAVPALLCMLFALVMQVNANFVNDYFDWKRGNDDAATRLGPLRACSMGWVSPNAMLYAIVSTICVAAAVGLPLVAYGGMQLIAVGVLCVIFCILYTTTLSYIGLGDLLVVVFFGLVPVCVTYYIQVGYVDADALLVSLACGLCTDSLLIVNNYRDIDNDRRDGKRTVIVLIGRKWGLRLYLLIGVAVTVAMASYVGFGWKSLFMLIYIIPHCHATSAMGRLKGRELNRVLGATARDILLFGVAATLQIML